MTEEYSGLLEELFQGRLDESSTITSPMQIDLADQITIGKRVFVNNNFICMARGGVEIEDDVMIAPGVSLLTANHDLYAYEVLLCSPIHIKKNA